MTMRILDCFRALSCLVLVGAQLLCGSVWSQQPAADAPAAIRLALWPKQEGQTSCITVHRPNDPNGVAIVICPGGGYGGLVVGPEGHGIAEWLVAHRITGVVLQYELPRGRPEVPVRDARRAIRLVRAHAQEWSIAPDRIGIMGFSAGGHLAATAATQFDTGDADAADAVDRLSSRPDFAALIYPVITMGAKTHRGSRRNLLGPEPSAELVARYSNEQHVTAQTPPTFLAHAQDDRVVVPDNSRLFYEALQRNGVPARYLELPRGGHGLNGYRGPMWDAWQRAFLQWLRQRAIIPQD